MLTFQETTALVVWIAIVLIGKLRITNIMYINVGAASTVTKDKDTQLKPRQEEYIDVCMSSYTCEDIYEAPM